jgi:1,4-alpha-glucan branching enzyme
VRKQAGAASVSQPSATPSPPPAPTPAQRPAERPSTPPTSAPRQGEKSIEFKLRNPHAKSAFVAGSFNSWDLKRTPMRKESDGEWKATVSLAPGRYEYRFVVDGQWISDPMAKESVHNTFGSTNSVVTV